MHALIDRRVVTLALASCSSATRMAALLPKLSRVWTLTPMDKQFCKLFSPHNIHTLSMVSIKQGLWTADYVGKTVLISSR